MCGMNLAFDRTLIGPTMWFGLMGAGQPLGRYDDMWAGWCSKVVCDHLDLGVKTGKPYIWHSKASDPLVNLEKEFKGILWQEHMVDFFRRVKLPKEADTASRAYAALASELKKSNLPKIDPYFSKVAEGMETWLEVWAEFNPEEEGKGEKEKKGRSRMVLSEGEKASASARGPASAAAVLLAAASVSSSSSSSSSKSDDDGADQENAAPFTPQQALAGKAAPAAAASAAAAAEEGELAGLFASKAAV